MIILRPYEGVGPIAFGMNVDEIATSIGSPNSMGKNRRGETLLRYEDLHITLSNEGVVEVELFPKSNAYLGDIAVFSDPHALQKLCSLDEAPKKCLEAIILIKLGMSITGLRSLDNNQKSVSVFVQGRFDALRPQMEPFSILM